MDHDLSSDVRNAVMSAARDRRVRWAFRALAIIEACTWAGLIVSMIIKYPLGGSPAPAAFFGQIHGITWLLFILGCAATGVWFRWGWRISLTGMLSSIVPFATIPFDYWVERRHSNGRRHRPNE